MNVLLLVPAAAAAVAGLVSLTAAGGGSATTGLRRPRPSRRSAPSCTSTQCASCHGVDGEGVEERGPTLVDEGPAAVDFVLRTGRMPMAAPNMQAKRGPVRYSDTEIRALVAYAGAFGNGPAIPDVDSGRRRPRRSAASCTG